MNHTQLTKILSKIRLFSALDEQRLLELAQISSTHSYLKNSVLFREGDYGQSLMILIKGEVKVCKHDEKGNRVTMGHFVPNAILAEVVILRQIPFPATAFCEQDCQIIKIRLDVFIEKFIVDATISFSIIQSLLSKIQLLENNINMHLAISAKGKILTFFKNSENLKLELKNYEVAAILGMSPETFSRNIKQLEKVGKLYKEDAHYKVKEL